jgi:hypothetical protein
MKALHSAVLIVFLAGIQPAWSTEPDFPSLPGDYCENMAKLWGKNGAILKDNCEQLEKKSKENARRVWAEIPSEGRSQCLSLVEAAVASYQGLAGCISIYVASKYLEGKLKLVPIK